MVGDVGDGWRRFHFESGSFFDSVLLCVLSDKLESEGEVKLRQRPRRAPGGDLAYVADYDRHFAKVICYNLIIFYLDY